jgi:hypothetical protein
MAAPAKKAKPEINTRAMLKIIALLKTRHEEDGALIDELERLAGGDLGIGEILKLLYEHWDVLWSQEHGGHYVFKFTEDTPNMKRLFRQLGLEELKARMANYLKDRGEWVMKHKHPFSAFVKTNNSYASAKSAAGDEAVVPPVDCKHKPPCRSDQEHTRKKLAAR